MFNRLPGVTAKMLCRSINSSRESYCSLSYSCPPPSHYGSCSGASRIIKKVGVFKMKLWKHVVSIVDVLSFSLEKMDVTIIIPRT